MVSRELAVRRIEPNGRTAKHPERPLTKRIKAVPKTEGMERNVPSAKKAISTGWVPLAFRREAGPIE